MQSRKSVYGLFNDSFPPVIDGVTLTVQNYVRWLAGRGRDVCVVTPWNPYDPPHPDFRMHRYFSLPIYNRHPYRYGYPLADPFIWMKMRRVPFRIVHAHCPFSSGRLARYAAKVHSVPLVATFHSKYKTDLDRSLPQAMVAYQMRRIRRFYNSADAVWIPQAAVEETVRQYGITAPVTVMPNGNDLGAADPRPIGRIKQEARQALGVPPGRMVLLFVGQHIWEKGTGIIIDALAHLAQHSTLDWEMHFVGTGYAAGQMRRRTDALGLGPRVTFHGVVNERRRLAGIYAAASVFLFPSFYDNAPLVVREAAAMGAPSVLLRGSTASEVIADGVNGLLTDRTPEAYADAIAALGADPARLQALADGARRTLPLPWDSVMHTVASKYEEIIDRYETLRRRDR